MGFSLSSVRFSHSVMSDSLWPHGLQHTRLPCPSPTPKACSDSCPLSQWSHPTISSSVIPFSCLQSFLASGSFPMSQFFTSRGQSIGVSASSSVLPMNIQEWFPLGWTGWISLQSKGLSRVFSNMTAFLCSYLILPSSTICQHQFLPSLCFCYSNPSRFSSNYFLALPQNFEVAVQLLSCAQLFATPWIAIRQTPLSFTFPRVCSEFMSIK